MAVRVSDGMSAPEIRAHKSQGREYAAVGIVGLNDGQFPDFRARTESAMLDELRTFYVSITRPRRVLLFTRAKARDTKYGLRATQPSKFLSLVTTKPRRVRVPSWSPAGAVSHKNRPRHTSRPGPQTCH